ncbi:MAG: hypothetical protein M3Q27_17335 [Actinomycetota bacterium]|nr:hypothetical protein [Actinomycetota bacterium]
MARDGQLNVLGKLDACVEQGQTEPVKRNSSTNVPPKSAIRPSKAAARSQQRRVPGTTLVTEHVTAAALVVEERHPLREARVGVEHLLRPRGTGHQPGASGDPAERLCGNCRTAVRWPSRCRRSS